MENNLIILILLPVITAIISSYLTYYFTIKSKKDEAILKFREEKYSNLLILLQGFIGETVSGEVKKRFFEEQYKSWLYCSYEVVKAINSKDSCTASKKSSFLSLRAKRSNLAFNNINRL